MLTRAEIDDLDIAITTANTTEKCVEFVQERGWKIIIALRDAADEIDELISENTDYDDDADESVEGEISCEVVGDWVEEVKAAIEQPMLSRRTLKEHVERLEKLLAGESDD